MSIAGIVIILFLLHCAWPLVFIAGSLLWNFVMRDDVDILRAIIDIQDKKYGKFYSIKHNIEVVLVWLIGDVLVGLLVTAMLLAVIVKSAWFIPVLIVLPFLLRFVVDVIRAKA